MNPVTSAESPMSRQASWNACDLRFRSSPTSAAQTTSRLGGASTVVSATIARAVRTTSRGSPPERQCTSHTNGSGRPMTRLASSCAVSSTVR
jgi:hypothetical protein